MEEPKELKELETITSKCFSCLYCYTCRYYQNSIWDWYIFTHPEEGCPAEKYEFDSLYKEVLKNQQHKQEQKRDKGKKKYGHRR